MKKDKEIFVSKSFAIAVYLVANPGIIVSEFDRKRWSYFKYDELTGKFMYRVPSNKKLNNWREARGLKQHFDAGMHNLMVSKYKKYKSRNIEDLPF